MNDNFQTEKEILFQTEKEILAIQWANVRYYWDKTNQAVLQMTGVPFLLLFSKLLPPQGVLTHGTRLAVKIVLLLAVGVFAVLVHRTLENYYQRSLRARRVIVEIEKRWGLYDKGGLLVDQNKSDPFRYAAFAHEKHPRWSHQRIQIRYADLVSLLSLAAVFFFF